MADAYDLVPYTEHAYAESHPDNLRVVAAMAGFDVDAGPTPRVLELGSGRGGNLLPMAASWREASFVGIDRSTVQTRDAARVAGACGLSNASFVSSDFVASPVRGGPFDFVLCHGVHSWVAPAHRRALLHRVRECLAPSGLAYVSLNVLPGWYRKMAARSFLRFSAASGFASGPREALAWLTSVVSPEQAGYRADLAAVERRLAATDDAYLTHEYLGDEHHPVDVTTFLTEAREAGLSYVADAIPREVSLDVLADDVFTRATARGLEAAQAVHDFVRDVAFRRALLVRSDTLAERGVHPRARLDRTAVERFRVASRFTPTGGGTFAGPVESVQLVGVVAKALAVLAERAPRSMTVAELASVCDAPLAVVANELFDVWLATPGLDLSLREPDLVTAVSARPCATPVARWHALDGGPITNVWHQEVVLAEPVVRFILARLDGKTAKGELVRAVHDREASLSTGEAEAVVDASLALLARSALVVG